MHIVFDVLWLALYTVVCLGAGVGLCIKAQRLYQRLTGKSQGK